MRAEGLMRAKGLQEGCPGPCVEVSFKNETWIFCDAALKTYSFFLYSYTHDLTLERCRPECL
jgi:hypothetical protein